MAQLFDLIAEFRDGKGRGASRRLRRIGMVPAIIYGGGKDPVSITFKHDELMHKMDNESFYSSILTVKVGDKTQSAILKAVQRHPAKHQVMHIDLQRILKSEKIKMRVPLHFTGEEECFGVKEQGGVVSKVSTDVDVTCLPQDLPEYLELDIADLELDNSLRLSDIDVPEGVELSTLALGEEYDQPVVSVHRPRAEEEIEPPEGEEEELAEGEEGEEGEPTEGEPKADGDEEPKPEE